jgi:DTW domain-containing protein YfiP
MFDTEPMKPSNTGRLIADILPDTTAFLWSRTEPPQALIDLCASEDYQPMVVFPASYAGSERQVLSAPPSGKPPLFIMLDGTWTEARKMFRKSPYLDALPVISVDLSRVSAYRLRESHAEDQYCTAEVAIALLDLAGDQPAAKSLGAHFPSFANATWRVKRIISVVSQQKKQKTFKIIRSLFTGGRYEPTWAGSVVTSQVDRRDRGINETGSRRFPDDAQSSGRRFCRAGFAGDTRVQSRTWGTGLAGYRQPALCAGPRRALYQCKT